MKVKVTDKKCGLEAGKVYDLCPMAAKNLINNGQAVVAIDAPAPVVVEPVTEAKKGQANGTKKK